MTEHECVESAAADTIKILATSLLDQVCRFKSGKTVRRAGPTQETVEERLLKIFIPFDMLFDQASEQGDPSTGYAGLVPGGTKDRAGHLAEPATIASGDFVVVL